MAKTHDPQPPSTGTSTGHHASEVHTLPTESTSVHPDAPPARGPVSLDFLGRAQTPDEIGRLGNYRILQVLGSGGMGVVFRAEDVQLQRPVAVKAILPEIARRPEAKERFLREAKAAGKLDHDHVVSVYHVGEERGVPFIVMPLLQGSSLEGILRTSPRPGCPLGLAETLRVGREIAEGLAAAHAIGLVHRDVKPANVWLDAAAGKRVKILDFGLARLAQGSGEQDLTRSGAVLGTPAYMAPEQARGEQVDGRADLFSLGVVLYRLCTGTMPFKGTDPVSTLLSVARDEPAPPATLSPQIPPALSELVMKLLAKDPARRVAAARDVVSALRAIERDLARNTIDATAAIDRNPPSLDQTMPLASTPPVARTPSRSRLPALVGTLAVVALLLGVGGYFLARPLFPIQPEPPRVAETGTLLVDLNDPDAEVAVKVDGVVVQERTKRREFTVKAGAGTVEVFGKDGDKPVAVEKFALGGDGRETVRVNLPPKPAPPPQPPPALTKITADPAVPMLNRHEGPVWAVHFLRDGKRVLSTGWDGTVRVWDVTTGKQLHALKTSHWDKLYQGLAVSTDEKLVAVGGSKEGAFLWDLAEAKYLRQLRFTDGWASVRAMAFTPNHERLLVASTDGTLAVFRVQDGKQLSRSKVFEKGSISCLVLLPDNRILLGAEFAPEVVLWDVDKGKEVRRYPGNGTGVYALAPDPDGKRFYAGAEGGMIRIWELETGKEVGALRGHGRRVRGLHVLPGNRLLSTSEDNTIRLWDVPLGEEIDRVSLDPTQSLVAFSAVSPDGRRAVVGSGWRIFLNMERFDDYKLRQFQLPAGPKR